MILEELLKEERFCYLKILSKNPDLSRAVMTVESTETPDVARYIPQNTFLLMTGMAFQESQQPLCEFLEALNRHECAGVAIKLGRFLNELEEYVLETADRLGIPLFQIPMNVTLGEVYHELLSYIWNNQNDNYLSALNIQRKISNLILHGSSMKIILNNLTAILQKPVMIIDMFGEIQDYGYTFDKTERNKSVQFVALLINEGVLENSFHYLHKEKGRVHCIYPIKGVGRNTNYLTVLDFNPEEKEELAITMEQVLMALGLYYYRNLYVQYNHMKSLEDFFSILQEQLNDKTWTERQVLSIGEAYGLRIAPEYQVVIISMKDEKKKKFNQDSFSKNEESYILVYAWIKKWLEEEEKDILIFPQDSEWRFILLIQGKKAKLKEKYVQIYDYVEDKFGKKITIAQGGVISSILNMKHSFQEAEDCMENGERNTKYEYLLSYKPKNIMELFKFVPERERKDICRFTLKELAFPQNQMQEELRKTLHTYLFCGSSITKTAENMFLHRNTIKYRVKKCEEILGIELSSVSDSFYLQLALVLSEKE